MSRPVIPWYIYLMGGEIGGIITGFTLSMRGWATWQCVLIGLGIFGLGIWLSKKLGYLCTGL